MRSWILCVAVIVLTGLVSACGVIPDAATVTPAPTATAIPPTATAVPPTATPIPPTATAIPLTATPEPTATPIPPTATPIPPTATPIPPTATVRPTATLVPVSPTSAAAYKATVASFGQNAPDFKEYTSKEGRFSAWMPDTVVMRTQPQQVLNATLDYHVYVAVGAKPHVTYEVIYVDLTDSLTAMLPPKDMLEQSSAGVVSTFEALKYTLNKEQDISLGANPGKDYSFSGENGSAIKLRTYVSGMRLYILQVLSATSLDNVKEVHVFLDSFKLLP